MEPLKDKDAYKSKSSCSNLTNFSALERGTFADFKNILVFKNMKTCATPERF